MLLRKAKTFLSVELGGVARYIFRRTWTNVQMSVREPEPISIVLICGNRLQELKLVLPALLNQLWDRYEVVLSLYADREGCADYCFDNFRSHIDSERLRIIQAEDERFSNSLSINNGVEAARYDLVHLWMTDLIVLEETGVRDVYLNHRMFPEYDLFSTPFVGTEVVRRKDFIEVGGYDTTDTGIQQPVDSDHIARHLVYFRGQRYLQHMPSRDWTLRVDGEGRIHERYVGTTVRQNAMRRHHCPVFNIGNERLALSQSPEDRLYGSIFYTRLGIDYRKDLESGSLNTFDFIRRTIQYFLDHNPKIPFETSDYEALS